LAAELGMSQSSVSRIWRAFVWLRTNRIRGSCPRTRCSLRRSVTWLGCT
jgi:hypothetical protein